MHDSPLEINALHETFLQTIGFDEMRNKTRVSMRHGNTFREEISDFVIS